MLHVTAVRLTCNLTQKQLYLHSICVTCTTVTLRIFVAYFVSAQNSRENLIQVIYSLLGFCADGFITAFEMHYGDIRRFRDWLHG